MATTKDTEKTEATAKKAEEEKAPTPAEEAAEAAALQAASDAAKAKAVRLAEADAFYALHPTREQIEKQYADAEKAEKDAKAASKKEPK